jgi:hypothetical protein
LLLTFLFIEPCISADELTITVPATVEETELFVVKVFSNETPIENATIIFNEENETTNSTGTATFYAPEVENNVTYNITAFKEGYQNATANITIINTPKLMIIITQEELIEGGYDSSVDVYVTDDQGNLINGATVTFEGQTLTTVNGKATIEVPQETTGMITASKDGYKDADGRPVTIRVQDGYFFLLLLFDLCPIAIIIGIICVIVILFLIWKKKKK